MVRVLGFLSLARTAANGPKWTREGPQNGPHFLKEFWGRRGVLILLAMARILLQHYYLRLSLYLLHSEYRHWGEYSCKFAIFTVQ